MDFRFTREQELFRQELRSFFQAELPPGWSGFEPPGEDHALEIWPITRQMSKKLASKGWLTLSWPKQYGGGGCAPLDELIYREQIAYHRVPGADMGIGGVTWIGPALMEFGTEEQKKEHLPQIAAGEKYWCTGYSEPNAGSDLAAVECRAAADGDDYLINGQKCWTSAAHVTDWCWLLVRTNTQVAKHKGLSLFLVDMRGKGISVKPRLSIVGLEQLNDVFFDNVRVPRKNLVGEENRGWYYVVRALDFERIGVVFPASAKRTLDDLVVYARDTKQNGKALAESPIIRNKLAEMAIEVDIGHLLFYRMAWLMEKNIAMSFEASMAKVYSTELVRRVASVGMELLGIWGQLTEKSKWAPLQGWMQHIYQYYIMVTIAAGTSEIQRNIIATRGLGLPR